MIRFLIVLLFIFVPLAAVVGQPPIVPVEPIVPPLFSDSERAAIVAYWNNPARLQMEMPENSMTKGLFQPRLTTDGSEWILKYKNATTQGGAPPTANPLDSEFNPEWKRWVKAKIAYDYYIATVAANAANMQALHIVAPIGPTAPPHPGIIPNTLLAACGNPPILANVVVPMVAVVSFENENEPFRYVDNVKLSDWYPYYRFAKGTVAYGPMLKDMPKLDLEKLFKDAKFSDRERRIVGAVSPLEGGFETINTYDTGFVSVGFVQFITWNDGRGSLSDVLLRMKTDKQTEFNSDFRRFGVDVNTTDKTLTVIDPATGTELRGLPAVIRVIEDKRLTALFQRACRRSPFRVAQIQTAKTNYWPADDIATATLADGTAITGKVSDIIKSEAGMANLFDRKVNRGSIFPLFNTTISDIAKAKHITKFGDLAKQEREIIKRLKYRADFLDTTKYPDISQPK